ncbi:hypothetical protein RN001_001410 [Aquatica leii]|uniref:Antistasin-like domain-containing protein n=1 Tax=Aquatica leii TaxID=1421715 RepID=A0AAN7Q409_9COLE|nr:hypothetical protein RN001_001410 [Aquatica leii]
MIHILSCAIYLFLVVQCNAQELIDPTVCKLIKCDVLCPYGFINDENGCSTCQCFDPCWNYRCPQGQHCEVQSRLCLRQPCRYIRKCVPCLEPICPRNCFYGYQIDNKGCKTCDCVDPCTFYICPADKYCITEPVTCEYDPFCGVRLKCVKKCPEILCTMFCPYGFELDCNNCAICKCKDPCNGVICPKYHYCFVNQIFCIRAPCPEPYAMCKNYCEDKKILLKDGVPVICNNNQKNECGLNHTCTAVKEVDTSYCCEQ